MESKSTVGREFGIALLEKVAQEIRASSSHQSVSPFGLGQAQSVYNDLFWRPFLGFQSYTLYCVLSSCAVGVASGYMVPPTVADLQGLAGFSSRSMVMGRNSAGGRPAQAGYMRKLIDEVIVRTSVKGSGRKRQYTFGVLLHLPVLTPEQARALPGRLGDIHERFLGSLYGFDLPAWRKYAVSTFVPDNVSVYGWAWLGDPGPTQRRENRLSEPPTTWQDSVLERDGYICRYCGKSASTVDFIIPQGIGGGNGLDNLVASCLECSRHKKSRTAAGAGMILRPEPSPTAVSPQVLKSGENTL